MVTNFTISDRLGGGLVLVTALTGSAFKQHRRRARNNRPIVC